MFSGNAISLRQAMITLQAQPLRQSALMHHPARHKAANAAAAEAVAEVQTWRGKRLRLDGRLGWGRCYVGV